MHYTHTDLTHTTNITAINTTNEKLVTYLKDNTDTTMADFLIPTHNTQPAHVLIFKINKHDCNIIKERF